MWKIVKILKYEEALLLSYLIVERFKRSISKYRFLRNPETKVRNYHFFISYQAHHGYLCLSYGTQASDCLYLTTRTLLKSFLPLGHRPDNLIMCHST